MPFDVLSTLISVAGGAAVKEAVSAAVKAIAHIAEKKLTPTEQRKLEKEVGSLIKIATDEDIRRYDPKVQKVVRNLYASGAKTGSGKTGSGEYRPVATKAARKSPAKKTAAPTAKRAVKRVSAKKQTPRSSL